MSLMSSCTSQQYGKDNSGACKGQGRQQARVKIAAAAGQGAITWAMFHDCLQEHAYYLLFQNRRPDYINGFIDKLIDWRRVEQRYEQATKSKL